MPFEFTRTPSEVWFFETNEGEISVTIILSNKSIRSLEQENRNTIKKKYLFIIGKDIDYNYRYCLNKKYLYV